MTEMVAVKDLVPGDILADEVLSISGKVLLGKEVALTNRHISLLNTWDIQSVFIDSDEEEMEEAENKDFVSNQFIVKEDQPSSNEYIRFNQDYDSIVTNIVQSFDIIKQHRIIPVSQMKGNAGKIYSSIESNFEILNHLLVSDNNLADCISRHSVMVAYFSGIIARQMNWSQQDIEGVTVAALLHDIGSLVVDRKPISHKSAYLSETAGLLKLANGLSAEIILGIVQHREYMNGTGFPRGTKGLQIHPYARILSIADNFHNYTYNEKGINPFPILELFKREMYGKFDTDICQTFISRVKDTLILNKVILSNNQEAEVIFFNKNNYEEPIVKCLDNQIIDLSKRKDLRISRIVTFN